MTDNTQKAQGSAAGYVEAFYDLANMMGIPAQPRSPKEVWDTEMRPRLATLLSQPPEASEGEADAYLKFWWDGQSPRTRVDLSEICEPWLDALKPTITPLYAHPPKPADQLGEARREVAALREALGNIIDACEEANSPTAKVRAEVERIATVALTKA